MSLPPATVLVAANNRNTRRKIRGTVAETNDTELAMAMNATPFPALAIMADRNGKTWQRPVISADGTMCVWGPWESIVPEATRDAIRDLAQAEPNIKAFAQGRGAGVPAEETITAFNARWKAAVGWTDPPFP